MAEKSLWTYAHSTSPSLTSSTPHVTFFAYRIELTTLTLLLWCWPVPGWRRVSCLSPEHPQWWEESWCSNMLWCRTGSPAVPVSWQCLGGYSGACCRSQAHPGAPPQLSCSPSCYSLVHSYTCHGSCYPGGDSRQCPGPPWRPAPATCVGLPILHHWTVPCHTCNQLWTIQCTQVRFTGCKYINPFVMIDEISVAHYE